MSILNLYGRMQTRYLSTDVDFTIPETRDFTDGSWLPTDLADREIGINLLRDKIYIRNGNKILELTTGADSYVRSKVEIPVGGPMGDSFYQFETPAQGEIVSASVMVTLWDIEAEILYYLESTMYFRKDTSSPGVTTLVDELVKNGPMHGYELRYDIDDSEGIIYLGIVGPSPTIDMKITSRVMLTY